MATPEELQAAFIARMNLPYDTVASMLSTMGNRADASIATLQTISNQLKDLPNITFPTVPDAGTLNLPNAPAAPALGSISDINLPAAPAAPPIQGIVADTPPAFNPTPISVSMPQKPAPIVAGTAPAAPTVTDVTLPAAPSITLPAAPVIDLPAFAFPTLPTFSAETPAISAIQAFVYSETPYTPAVVNEVKGRILAMLAGGTGLPSAIEQALFARAHDRQSQINYRAEQEVLTAFAARGWELPPGALSKQLEAVRDTNLGQVSETAREILTKAAEWEIENLRQAVAHGMTFEKLLQDQFHALANRAFEVAKYRFDADVARFNADVSAFNARQGALQTAATVFEAKLKAALAYLEEYRLRLDGERFKVQHYQAQLAAVQSAVDIYKVQMEGARVQSEVNKTRIDVYQAQIKAWAETIAARKIEFEAYETEVKAESAKIGIYEAEARAFAATASAYESGNNVKIQNVKIQIEQLDAQIKRHNVLLEAEKARISAEVSQISAQTELFKAKVGSYSAESSAAARTFEMQFSAQIKQYEALVSRLMQQAQLQMEALKALGQIHSQLAAGAMSASHVSASMSGSAGQSINDNLNNNHSYEH